MDHPKKETTELHISMFIWNQSHIFRIGKYLIRISEMELQLNEFTEIKSQIMDRKMSDQQKKRKQVLNFNWYILWWDNVLCFLIDILSNTLSATELVLSNN